MSILLQRRKSHPRKRDVKWLAFMILFKKHQQQQRQGRKIVVKTIIRMIVFQLYFNIFSLKLKHILLFTINFICLKPVYLIMFFWFLVLIQQIIDLFHSPFNLYIKICKRTYAIIKETCWPFYYQLILNDSGLVFNTFFGLNWASSFFYCA